MSNEKDEKIAEIEADWEQKRLDIEKEYVSLQVTMHKNTSMKLNREIQQRMYNKFDTDDALNCLRWIYEVTGIFPREKGFWGALRDGFLLSKLLITLHPPYGNDWNPRRFKANSIAAFKARAQLATFIERAREYGASSTMTVDNLYDGTNLSQVLTIIGALSREAEKRNFDGPRMIQTNRKKGRVAALMKRPSMTGFDLHQNIYRSDSEDEMWRDKRGSRLTSKFREGDKIDFLLLHCKEWLYEWAPGTILKCAGSISSTTLGVPNELEYSIIASQPETYHLEPDEAITIAGSYIRPRCKENFQLISANMEVRPEGGRENKIVQIVQELIETEATYLGGLSDIIIKYYDGLFGDGTKGILPEEFKSKILYYDLDTFYTMHRELYMTLKRARSIPGVIVANCDWLKMYCRYSNNYEKLLKEIRELRKNREVNQRWNETEKKVGQNIESLLITPIQRIPRYELLLKEMLKYTSKNHPQRITLKFAQAKITTIARKLNDAKDRIDKSTKLVKALEMITDVPSNVKLWASNRYFIKEQEFRRKSTSMYYTVKPCRLLLFNDMLVYADKSGKFRQLIMLVSIISVRAFSKENMKEGKFAIEIAVEKESSVEVFAKDETIQKEWIQLIEDQREECAAEIYSSRDHSNTTIRTKDFLRDAVTSRITI